MRTRAIGPAMVFERAAEKWKNAFQIDGADDVQLHQVYRAMAWLGEELPADRGMISQKTIEELESPERGWYYILGARMWKQKEVRDQVLTRTNADLSATEVALNWRYRFSV